MALNTNAPASASASPAAYSVFINHHGSDVKRTFASHLYRTLISHGLRVFLDQPELQTGQRFPSQIESAIQGASVQIAIFSENYAKSKWCLDELCLMIEAEKRIGSEKRGATILPVFYNVEPSELRRTGIDEDRPYAKALRKHEQRYFSQRIQSWRDALSYVADISGFELKAYNGDEAELLGKVVQRVLTKVPEPAMHVAKYATGLGQKMEDFEKTVLFQQEQQPVEVKVVGIAGVGGIGKTTLANEFFKCKRSHYAGSSFLADVREKASRSFLPSLQSKLIKDLKGINKEIGRWEEGTGILETCLSSCHALIILDDVDDADQLDAFLPPIKGVLDPKSLILVTSRDKHVLRSAGIAKSSIYHLKGLSKTHSEELFCSHAFFRPYPRPGFENLVGRFVNACDGLPLSLKVFGALLCEKDRHYWEEKLNELHKLPRKIMESLKISYDSLDQEEQQIFLDIACFAIGEETEQWLTIWGKSAGLQTLEDRCLVEVVTVEEVSKKWMKMHDQLRDMGRNIAEEVSMPRRLWRSIQDVHDLFEKQSLSSGIPKVRGIRMSSWATLEESSLRSRSEIPLNKISSSQAFRIRELQLLETEGEFVEGILSRVHSPNLIWLCWNDCPCSSLPSWIPMDHLKVLEVQGLELKKLWNSDSQAVPLQLRELYIDAPLLEFPKSIGKLNYLEKIVLTSRYHTADLPRFLSLPDEFFHVRSLKCLELTGYFRVLPNEFGNLTNLQRIVLSGYGGWKKLPGSFTNLTNLQHLQLSGCGEWKKLPGSFTNLTNLQHLQLSGCDRLKRLPKSLGDLTNLQCIILDGCKSLKKLPDSLGDLKNLQRISLEECKSLEVLPNSFGNLANLQRITLRGCESMEVLADSFGNLTNLLQVELHGFKRLKKLPDCFTDLMNLQQITLEVCESLELLPNSFGNLTNLQRICLSGCKSLEVLPESFGNLRNLRRIELSGFKRLKKLPDSFADLKNLQEITLAECESLELLPNSFGNLRNLRRMNLHGWNRLKRLPNTLGDLTNLQHLQLFGCDRLKRLPKSLGDLTNLQCIILNECKSLKKLPDSLGDLKYLQRISLYECKSLEVLPNSFGNLTNLQRITLRGCESLEILADSFGNLTNLLQVELYGCKRLKKLPDSFTHLMNLQEITLEVCESLELLSKSFGNLTNLQRINLSGCDSLEDLPNSFVNLRNLRHMQLSGFKRLKKLPDSFTDLKNLQEITLTECGSMEALPDSFGNLTNLEYINLSGCESLEVLPDSFGNLRNLRHIRLSGFKRWKKLPDSFTDLKNLQGIELYNCDRLKRLPHFLGDLTNLQEITLHGCESLEVLPDSVGNLKNLQRISLRDCSSLNKLPNSFGHLRNLQSIVLTACRNLKMLPSNSFGNLTNLREINLSDCESLKKLPDSLADLTNLHSINLRGCKNLKKLSISMGHFTNLRRINLSGCRSLKKLPKSLGLLTNLRSIDFSGCKSLKKFPNSLGNLLQLVVLDLSHCCMSLSTTLGNITSLFYLDFSGCVQMEVLPAQLEHQKSLTMLNLLGTNIKELSNAHTVCLSNLVCLYLGSPLLKELPPSLGCLSSLKILLLHGCQELKCLPDSVGQLTQLRMLEISKCGIHQLPGLMEMNNLETLRVRCCPLRELPFKEETAPGRKRKRRAKDKGLIGLTTLELYCTEISEVSFPEGVCPKLAYLEIKCCNDLVKVGSLPATVGHVILRGCCALSKIEGLSGVAKLLEVDLRGCYNIQIEELPHLDNATRLFIPADTYNCQQQEREVEEETAALQEGVLPDRFRWRLDMFKDYVDDFPRDELLSLCGL